jgi:hypothetical protein
LNNALEDLTRRACDERNEREPGILVESCGCRSEERIKPADLLRAEQSQNLFPGLLGID